MPASPSRFALVVFVLASAVVAAFATMFASRYFIPKDAGLAAGAMVIGYGVMGLLAGGVIALVLQRFMGAALIQRLNWMLGLLALGLLGWLGTMIYLSMKKGREDASKSLRPRTEVVAPPSSASLPPLQVGPGIARPPMEAGRPLHFYERPDSPAPADSLVLIATEYGQMNFGHTPTWLKPEYFKLDYDLLLFLVKSQKTGFLEIEVSKETGKTMWIKETGVTFSDWPGFLLEVHSVEPLDPTNNLIREEPYNHAPPLSNEEGLKNRIFHPLKIEGEWMEVEILDSDYQSQGTGWLRWRNGRDLQVRYNLLS